MAIQHFKCTLGVYSLLGGLLTYVAYSEHQQTMFHKFIYMLVHCMQCLMQASIQRIRRGGPISRELTKHKKSKDFDEPN